MGHPDYQDCQLSISKGIQDTVQALTQAVNIMPCQLFAARRAGVPGKDFYPAEDSLKIFFRDRLKIFFHRFLEKDLIFAHLDGGF